MRLTHAGRTRAPRHTHRTILCLTATTAAATALVALAPAHAGPAPPSPAAQAGRADPWSGVWHTHHQFGNPTLHLELEHQEGPDLVKGWYENDGGGGRGKIRGEVTRVHIAHVDVWEGRFRDDDGQSKGKFKVRLDLTEGTHFDGWFKTCGALTCSEKFPWSGDHS